jgi:hypothetical protein
MNGIPHGGAHKCGKGDTNNCGSQAKEHAQPFLRDIEMYLL